MSTKERPGRIDIHHHIFPPALFDELGAAMDAWNADFGRWLDGWSVAKALDDMDKGGVATVVTSVTQISMWGLAQERVRRLARACNDYAARTVADHPGRFGMFVTLPMPDIDGSLAEIAYGLDQLKADGVGIYSSYDSKWLGDPAFDPILAELDRRKAVVHVHPSLPPSNRNFVPGILDTSIEYSTDTTRAIARMVFSGAARRYPNIRMIWSHAGGSMPFLVGRFEKLASYEKYQSQFPGGFLPEVQRFYYDTANATHRVPLATTKMVIPVSNLVFGSDFPYNKAADQARELAASGLLSPTELRAVEHDNIAKLFPQFARA